MEEEVKTAATALVQACVRVGPAKAKEPFKEMEGMEAKEATEALVVLSMPMLSVDALRAHRAADKVSLHLAQRKGSCCHTRCRAQMTRLTATQTSWKSRKSSSRKQRRLSIGHAG